MNILPLVTAFMLLFAIGAYTLLQQAISTRQEERHFGAAQRLHWKSVSQIESALYKLHPGQSPSHVAKEKTKQPDKPYESPRTKFNLPLSAKLNISPLFSETPNPRLREIAAKLIERLYQATYLYRPGLADEVLNLLIDTGRQNPDCLTFAELFRKMRNPPHVLYKMLKGTQNYRLFTSLGYPSLDDYLAIAPKRAPIFMVHASKALLIAAFGDVFANQLILKEKESWEKEGKYIPLKKEEIEALFLEFGGHGKNLSDLDPLLDYKRHSRALDQQIYLDEKSKIQVRIK